MALAFVELTLWSISTVNNGFASFSVPLLCAWTQQIQFHKFQCTFHRLMHQSISAVPDFSEYCAPLNPITNTNSTRKKQRLCPLNTKMWYQNVLQLSEFLLFLIIPFSLDWQIKVIITNCTSFHSIITHEEQTKIPFYRQHILPHHRSSAYKSQTLLPYEIQPSLPMTKIMNIIFQYYKNHVSGKKQAIFL